MFITVLTRAQHMNLDQNDTLRFTGFLTKNVVCIYQTYESYITYPVHIILHCLITLIDVLAL
jgi:hypothetical protein